MTKGLQSAARTICTPLAYKSHTCSLIGIFCQVHAPTENNQNPFAACGRQTLRGSAHTGVGIPRVRGTAKRQALPPAFMRGEGHAVAGGVSRAAGITSSVTALPCQLPRRGSRGRFAPFLPPAFMRGEGHEVAGGVSRSGGESLLSHGFAVPAPPEGKPRGLRPVPAPRIYEGGGPRSGRGSPPPQRGRPSQSRFACQLSQRESQGSCAPFLPPAFMRGEGHAVAGGVPRAAGKASSVTLRTVPTPRIYEGGGPRSGRGSPPRRRGKPPQSRLRRASSPRGEAEGASHRSCPPHL